MKHIRMIALSVMLFGIQSIAHAQAWRNCVPGSISPGGYDSIGPGGGKSIGPGGGLSIGPGGGNSIGPGGGQSIGPGGGRSIGLGGRTNLAYRAAHQFAYPEGGIPARPFLGLSDGDRREIMAILSSHFDAGRSSRVTSVILN